MTDTLKLLFPMNLQTFAEDATEDQTPPTDDPVETPKTFTQEELDKIVADRIARERKKSEKYADYDELKTKLAEYEREQEEKQRSEMTEIERWKTDYEKEAAAKQTLEQSVAEMEAKYRQEKIRNVFITAAASANIAHIDDAYILASTDLAKVTFDESGNVVGMDSVIQSLVETKPFLIAQTKKEPSTIGGPSGYGHETGAKTLEAQLEEAKKKKDFGKVLELSNKLSQLRK
ncbi:hypothetical protein GOP56_11115 [Brevibacillus sp. 7WMA2]|uniref:phage scaffolding protein n=1 Tax=Brevibacillus sp. 7WMA2 TaxID=2683193 RepID=UPI0013A74A85|nr:hypothetical protein [Brevibacillus sp. 7WMA2]QIC06113.1 hypothetical protein GOP56_11115 [Brevibacillus sp. 7WMA2]